MVLSSAASLSNRSFLSLLFLGRKPSKENLSVERPDRTRPVIPAEGPGRTLTPIPSCLASLTRSAPGSEIPGIPASEQ